MVITSGHKRTLSIHAPARGATQDMSGAMAYAALSIHAPARGATIGKRLLLSRWSTFNPRAREGRDIKVFGYVSFGELSIHAPARGAT